MARLGALWQGKARNGTAGEVRRVWAGPVMAGMVWIGPDRPGTAGMARTAFHGRARPCRRGDGMKRIRHGRRGGERRAREWRDMARPVIAGMAGLGKARRGPAGLAWRGEAGRGEAWPCRHGEAGIGPARRGMVRLAELGVVAHQRGRDFLPHTLFLI